VGTAGVFLSCLLKWRFAIIHRKNRESFQFDGRLISIAATSFEPEIITVGGVK
jgi:hypothetical protein